MSAQLLLEPLAFISVLGAIKINQSQNGSLLCLLLVIFDEVVGHEQSSLSKLHLLWYSFVGVDSAVDWFEDISDRSFELFRRFCPLLQL